MLTRSLFSWIILLAACSLAYEGSVLAASEFEELSESFSHFQSLYSGKSLQREKVAVYFFDEVETQIARIAASGFHPQDPASLWPSLRRPDRYDSKTMQSLHDFSKELAKLARKTSAKLDPRDEIPFRDEVENLRHDIEEFLIQKRFIQNRRLQAKFEVLRAPPNPGVYEIRIPTDEEPYRLSYLGAQPSIYRGLSRWASVCAATGACAARSLAIVSAGTLATFAISFPLAEATGASTSTRLIIVAIVGPIIGLSVSVKDAITHGPRFYWAARQKGCAGLLQKLSDALD